MPSYGINIANGSAQAIWYGDDREPKPITVTNSSTGNVNIWIATTPNAGPTDQNDSTMIAPGGYLSLDGKASVYYASADGLNAQITLMPGVTSFFLPASLSSLGGVKVFVQSAEPTQPPVIPTNSLWFDTSTGAMYVWSGSIWGEQSFSGSQLIQDATILGAQIANGTLTTAQIAAAAGILGTQIADNTITGSNIAANTITASLLAAGIVVAGIVDGTTISAATFEGTNFIFNENGLFLYTGTPALGNMFASFAPQSGTDTYGNNYGQGFNVGTWSAAGAMDQHFGIDINGNVYVANTAGKTATYVYSSTGAILIYNSSGAGAGNLIMSVSPVAGVDPYGNAYQEGFTIYDGSSNYVQIHVNTTYLAPAIELPSGISSEYNHPSIYNKPTNVGLTNEYENLVIAGPASTYDQKWAALILTDTAKDGSTDTAGVGQINNTQIFYWDSSGVHILASLYGNGGTISVGDNISLASGKTISVDSWHTITLDSGWSTGTYALPRYRILPDGNLQLSGRCYAAAWSGAKALNSSNPLPANARPAYPCDFYSSDAVGNRCHISISTAGVITANTQSGATGTWYAEINGIVPLT